VVGQEQGAGYHSGGTGARSRVSQWWDRSKEQGMTVVGQEQGAEYDSGGTGARSRV